MCWFCEKKNIINLKLHLDINFECFYYYVCLKKERKLIPLTLSTCKHVYQLHLRNMTSEHMSRRNKNAI